MRTSSALLVLSFSAAFALAAGTADVLADGPINASMLPRAIKEMESW